MNYFLLNQKSCMMQKQEVLVVLVDKSKFFVPKCCALIVSAQQSKLVEQQPSKLVEQSSKTPGRSGNEEKPCNSCKKIFYALTGENYLTRSQAKRTIDALNFGLSGNINVVSLRKIKILRALIERWNLSINGILVSGIQINMLIKFVEF